MLAERAGFEPACDCSQTDFESAPLWPLRYLSVYTNLDSSLRSTFWQQRDWNEGCYDNYSIWTAEFSLRQQGGSGNTWPVDGRISSAARYDHFDTLPYNKYSVFGESNMISSAAPSTTRTTLHMSIRKSFPKLLERTDGKNCEIFGFSNCGSPQKHWILSGQNWHFFENFRVSPVMTTSIPLRI